MHLSEVKSLVQTHPPQKWLIQTRFQGFQHLAASLSPAGNTRASDNISLFTGPLWGTMKSTFLWSMRVWIDNIVHWSPSPPPLFQLVFRRQRLFWICSPKPTLPIRVQGTRSAFLNLYSGMKEQTFQSPILKEQDTRKHIRQWGVMERR